MTVRVGAPDTRHQGRLVWPFGEDAITASYELVRSIVLPPGAGATIRGMEPPAWWWKATGLSPSDSGPWSITALSGTSGDAVIVTDEEVSTVDAVLVRALSRARELGADEAAALRRANDPAPIASDFPLGAAVTAGRHDEVLLERLAFPSARIETWTTVAPGAGPAEFQRLQEALGAYHVVLVRAPTGHATVGLWTPSQPPSTGMEVRPVLRRLYRRDGAWRYGVAFAPTL